MSYVVKLANGVLFYVTAHHWEIENGNLAFFRRPDYDTPVAVFAAGQWAILDADMSVAQAGAPVLHVQEKGVEQ